MPSNPRLSGTGRLSGILAIHSGLAVHHVTFATFASLAHETQTPDAGRPFNAAGARPTLRWRIASSLREWPSEWGSAESNGSAERQRI